MSLTAASSESAVVIRGDPARRCRQRAADSAPAGGTDAPASAAGAGRDQPGACVVHRTNNAAIAATNTVAVTDTTRACPRRSTARATCGPTTASATANTPVAVPADT